MKVQNIPYSVSVNKNNLQSQQNFFYDNYQNVQKNSINQNIRFGSGFGFSWNKVWTFIKEVLQEELEKRGMSDLAKKLKDAASKSKKVKKVPRLTPEEKAQKAATKQQRRAEAKLRKQEKVAQTARNQEEKQNAEAAAKAERLAKERQKQIEECRLSEAEQDLRVVKIKQKEAGAIARAKEAKQEQAKIDADGMRRLEEFLKQKEIRETINKLDEFNKSIFQLSCPIPKTKNAFAQMSLLRDFKEEKWPDMPQKKFLKYISGKKGFRSFRKFVEGKIASLQEILPENLSKDQAKTLKCAEANMLKAAQEKNKRQREINLACAKLKEFLKYINKDAKTEYEQISFLRDFKTAKYKDMPEDEFIKYIETTEGFSDFNKFFAKKLDSFKKVLPTPVIKKFEID